MDRTAHAQADAAPTGAALREAWTRLRSGRPSLDMREAALGLGVSEMELVASMCGDGATRLLTDWGALAASLPELGMVVASTQNARASIRCRGTHPGPAGRVTVLPIDPIDVHVASRAVHAVFAVRESDRSSIRLFDAAGTRTHEIALLDSDGRGRAFDAVVALHASPDQTPRVSIARASHAVPPAPGAESVVRSRWEALGDPDDVAALCVALGLTRHEGLRAAPPEWVWPVARQCVRQVLGWVATEAIPVTVTVGNAVVRQARSGCVARPEDQGRSLVTRTREFAFHLRTDRVASAWVVSMPGGRTRVATALEILDEKGAPIARIAGADDRRDMDAQRWWALLGRLPVASRG